MRFRRDGQEGSTAASMDDGTRIDQLFAEIRALLPSCDALHVRRQIAELQVALELVERSGERPLAADDDAAIVRKAQALMADNIQTPLTIAELANSCDTSPTKLKRTFRSVLDTSVFQWYRTLRIEHSERLLIETDLPIAQIAASVGYANPSKFSRAFQEHTGTTPRSWRSRMRRRDS